MAVNSGWVGSSAKAETGKTSMGDARVALRLSRAGWMSEMSGRSTELSYNVSASGQNANLRTLVNNLGYGGDSTIIKVSVSGNYSSTSTGIPALDIGEWPAGVNLEVIIASTITGKGGAGGAAGSWGYKYRSVNPPGAGGVGGPAIRATNSISGGSIKISLSGGIIRAGGGGGGGLGAGTDGNTNGSDKPTYYNGASGGRGAGTDGGATSGGVSYDGKGGSGGSYGARGGTGSVGGGAGGAAIIGSSNATLVGWSSGGNYFGSVA